MVKTFLATLAESTSFIAVGDLGGEGVGARGEVQGADPVADDQAEGGGQEGGVRRDEHHQAQHPHRRHRGRVSGV